MITQKSMDATDHNDHFFNSQFRIFAYIIRVTFMDSKEDLVGFICPE